MSDAESLDLLLDEPTVIKEKSLPRSVQAIQPLSTPSKPTLPLVEPAQPHPRSPTHSPTHSNKRRNPNSISRSSSLNQTRTECQSTATPPTDLPKTTDSPSFSAEVVMQVVQDVMATHMEQIQKEIMERLKGMMEKPREESQSGCEIIESRQRQIHAPSSSKISPPNKMRRSPRK